MSEPITQEFGAELYVLVDDAREDDTTAVVHEIDCRCDPEDEECARESPCTWHICGPCTDQSCGCDPCSESRQEFRDVFNDSDMPLTASSICVDFRGETVFSAVTGPFEHPKEEGKLLYGVLMGPEDRYQDSEMEPRVFWAYSSSPSVVADAYESIVRNPRLDKFRGWDATDVASAPLAPSGQLVLPDALAGR